MAASGAKLCWPTCAACRYGDLAGYQATLVAAAQLLVAGEPPCSDPAAHAASLSATLPHRRHCMQAYSTVGMMREAYVRDAVAAHIWDARSDDLEVLGLKKWGPFTQGLSGAL